MLISSSYHLGAGLLRESEDCFTRIPEARADEIEGESITGKIGLSDVSGLENRLRTREIRIVRQGPQKVHYPSKTNLKLSFFSLTSLLNNNTSLDSSLMHQNFDQILFLNFC